jgi:hypothetical protein
VFTYIESYVFLLLAYPKSHNKTYNVPEDIGTDYDKNADCHDPDKLCNKGGYAAAVKKSPFKVEEAYG